MFPGLITGLRDLVFPPLCIGCHHLLTPSDKPWQICPNCRQRVIRNRPPFCQMCSRPLSHFSKPFCKTCRRLPRAFNQAWAATFYTDKMSDLLFKFKYGQKTGLRYFFSHLMLAFVETYRLPLATIDLIVPIPLHPSRQRERGFNQSELLAALVSRRLAIPLSAGHLVRVRPTGFQARLRQKERWTNLEAAFKMKSSLAVRGKNILLIDDLLTTGATSSGAAQVLKTAGAATVYVLALAVAIDKPNNHR